MSLRTYPYVDGFTSRCARASPYTTPTIVASTSCVRLCGGPYSTRTLSTCTRTRSESPLSALATICPHRYTHTPPSSEFLLFNSVEVLRGASVDIELCRLLSRTIRRTHPQPSSCPVAAILGFAIVIKEKFLIDVYGATVMFCRSIRFHIRLVRAGGSVQRVSVTST